MSTKTINFRTQVLALLGDIRARYGWRLPALVLLMACVALSEGGGMVLLLPLLNAVGVSGQAGSGMLGSAITGYLTTIGVQDSAYELAALLLVVFAFQLLLFLVQTWWVSWLSLIHI